MHNFRTTIIQGATLAIALVAIFAAAGLVRPAAGQEPSFVTAACMSEEGARKLSGAIASGGEAAYREYLDHPDTDCGDLMGPVPVEVGEGLWTVVDPEGVELAFFRVRTLDGVEAVAWEVAHQPAPAPKI